MRWEDVCVLAKDLSEIAGMVTFETGCSDGVKRTFTTLDDLDIFRNPAGRAITSLSFEARSADYTQSWTIEFTTLLRALGNLLLDLKGEEDTVMQVEHVVNDRVSAMRPWYALIAKADFYWITLWSLVGYWVADPALSLARLGITEVMRRIRAHPRPPLGPSLLEAFLLSLIPIAVGVPLNRLRTRVVPMLTFAFGDGELRHKNGEVLRQGVLLTFFISLVATIIGAIVMSHPF